MTHPFAAFVPKGKPANYYNQTRKELGYVIPPTQSESETDESLPSYSSDLSDWESDVGVGVVFKNLFVNMTSISLVDHDEDVEPFDIDPWAQQLNFQWERRFEQREPPTGDKVI